MQERLDAIDTAHDGDAPMSTQTVKEQGQAVLDALTDVPPSDTEVMVGAWLHNPPRFVRDAARMAELGAKLAADDPAAAARLFAPLATYLDWFAAQLHDWQPKPPPTQAVQDAVRQIRLTTERVAG